MRTPSLVLGLDVGTSRIKALLLDRAGESAGFSSVSTPFTRDSAGTAMSVDALQTAVRQALEGLGPAREDVAGIGIAGVAESGAPLDDGNRPLAPIIAWHDPRGEDTVALLEERLGGELGHRIGQRLRSVSSVAKLGWLLQHGVDGVRRWLGVPELCLFHLAGAQVTEHSLVARTGCYDIGRHRYMPEVAEVVGFPIDVFPPVHLAGRVMGRVSAAGSGWSGLPLGTPVTLAGHDHLAGVDGCGAEDEDLVNSVGSAETVIARHRVLPDVDRAIDLRVAVTVRPGADGWATLASAARSGILLERVTRMLQRPPEALDGMAAGATPAEAGRLLEALERGEQPTPPSDPPGAVWAGVLHVLARRTGEAIERLGQLSDGSGRAKRLVVFGGGSRSQPWLAAKAAALEVPVWRSTVADAVSRGAALRAGVAAGWWATPGQGPPAALEPVTVPAGTQEAPGVSRRPR